MKTLFLKNVMPVATAVLAIAGAFATTSMQSSSSSDVFQPIIGYVLEEDGGCDIPVACSTIPNPQVCKVWYPFGAVAFEKNPVTGKCVKVLFRP